MTDNHKGDTAQATEASAQQPKRQQFAAYGVQATWLDGAHGQTVRVRLLDGKALSGTLTNHDIYCLALQQPGHSAPTLIFKHAVAYLLLGEDGVPPLPSA